MGALYKCGCCTDKGAVFCQEECAPGHCDEGDDIHGYQPHMGQHSPSLCS